MSAQVGAAPLSLEAREAAAPRELWPWLAPLVAALAVAAGAYLRVRGLSSLFPWGDEFHSLKIWQAELPEILATYDDRGSGVALPLLQRGFHDLLGPTLVAARMPALLGGLATLALTYPVGRRFVGKTAAALATAAVAASPMLVFYAHFGRGYALASALGLLLALALFEAAGERRRTGALVLACGAAALLPWVHATAAVLVVALCVAALLYAGANGRRTRCAEIAACTVIAFALCAALYLPAWDQAFEFFTSKAGSRSSTRVPVLAAASILAGGTTSAWVLLFAAPAGACVVAFSRRSAALLPIAGAFALLATLWAVSPGGGPFAYARYLLASLPFALILAAGLLVATVEWAARRIGAMRGARFDERTLEAGSRMAAFAAGVAVICAGAAAGHGSPFAASEGPFAGTYLSLFPLARFDQPWERAPRFYRRLADRDDIDAVLEVPMPRSRATLLYRSYAQAHGKEVALGEVGPAAVVGTGIFSLRGALDACASGADVAVLHVRLQRELAAYWDDTYPRSWSAGLSRAVAAIERTFHRTPLWFRRGGLAELSRDFARVFGEPVYADGLIEVYALDPAICR